MPELYVVCASRTITLPNGYESTKDIPTFYLHPNVQGILDGAGAERVAREILEWPNSTSPVLNITTLRTTVS